LPTQKIFNTHYLILTDAIKSIDSYNFIKNIMSSEEFLGFSIVMLVDKISALPNECKNFIQVDKIECYVFSSALNTQGQKFKIDYSPIDELYNCSRELANIMLDIKSDAETKLPDIYHFLEMYQIGNVNQLNVLDRWKKSNPILSLQAPVGIGQNGEIITLDLHEKFHGPHGLIAGTTGSGKSEFIITYILSLAINYHPSEVQIILIDYKGGGLAGAFSNDMYYLPHLAGTITNLDGTELNRSLASIESEVKRRQREFNDARKISNESTMDIYKYQKLYREGKLKDKSQISHLFIISDEFAELKEQRPEFMEKLISVARVGRSLGVHLILATQKPGGVVDQQIWSNTRFRVCLKVQETGDSQEVLKKPDAAYLQKQGRFFLQVGTNEIYTLGQAAWAGGQYYPSTSFKKENDLSVNLINNIGYTIATKEAEVKEVLVSAGEELPNIVKYICDESKKENIKIKKLWLDKIPEKIFIDNLRLKYEIQDEKFVLNPVIGEYDDPNNQEQYALRVPLTKHGNAIIYGITGSGKEDFLNSLLYSCMISHSPKEVNFYIMDFGSEAMRVFSNSPYVGDIVYMNETDKLKNLFKMIFQEMERRKDFFSNISGTYKEYIKRGTEDIPNWVVLINNYEAFLENYEDLTDELNTASREAYKYGIYFIITANSENGVRIKTRQNFSLIYVLQQNNDADYSSILGNVRGKLPAKIPGRGLFKHNQIFEFQTALITQEDQTAFLLDFNQKCLESYSKGVKHIPMLPNKVDYNYISTIDRDKNEFVVAVNKNTLEPVKYNFEKNMVNLVSSNDIENIRDFIEALCNEIIYANYYQTIFINTSEYKFNINGTVISDHYSELLTNLEDYLKKLNDMYEQNGRNNRKLDGVKKCIIVIYGLKDFFNQIGGESKKTYENIIKLNDKVKNVFFIIADNPQNIKTYAFDDWYKMSTDTANGIWIGSGIVDQILFKISRFTRDDSEEIKNNFGYVITNARLSKCKMLTEFNITTK